MKKPLNPDKATQIALKNLDEVGFNALSKIDKTLATLWALEAEVNNGGFDQFFLNSAGDLSFYAPMALREIGALQAAELAERANSVFGKCGPPKVWEARQILVLKFSKEAKDLLNQLDRAFYQYPDDISKLIQDYLEKNLA